MIKIEMDLMTAAAVRQALYIDTKVYTYDPACVPQRVTNIRSVILDLDNQIEENLREQEKVQEQEE
tara:strand:- start:171 stop:368 length:198 start_codon:yes stop_codon:yes gene_type:complete